jgi:hypothetical protein
VIDSLTGTPKAFNTHSPRGFASAQSPKAFGAPSPKGPGLFAFGPNSPKGSLGPHMPLDGDVPHLASPHRRASRVFHVANRAQGEGGAGSSASPSTPTPSVAPATAAPALAPAAAPTAGPTATAATAATGASTGASASPAVAIATAVTATAPVAGVGSGTPDAGAAAAAGTGVSGALPLPRRRASFFEGPGPVPGGRRASVVAPVPLAAAALSPSPLLPAPVPLAVAHGDATGSPVAAAPSLASSALGTPAAVLQHMLAPIVAPSSTHTSPSGSGGQGTPDLGSGFGAWVSPHGREALQAPMSPLEGAAVIVARASSPFVQPVARSSTPRSTATAHPQTTPPPQGSPRQQPAQEDPAAPRPQPVNDAGSSTGTAATDPGNSVRPAVAVSPPGTAGTGPTAGTASLPATRGSSAATAAAPDPAVQLPQPQPQPLPPAAVAVDSGAGGPPALPPVLQPPVDTHAPRATASPRASPATVRQAPAQPGSGGAPAILIVVPGPLPRRASVQQQQLQVGGSRGPSRTSSPSAVGSSANSTPLAPPTPLGVPAASPQGDTQPLGATAATAATVAAAGSGVLGEATSGPSAMVLLARQQQPSRELQQQASVDRAASRGAASRHPTPSPSGSPGNQPGAAPTVRAFTPLPASVSASARGDRSRSSTPQPRRSSTSTTPQPRHSYTRHEAVASPLHAPSITSVDGWVGEGDLPGAAPAAPPALPRGLLPSTVPAPAPAPSSPAAGFVKPASLAGLTVRTDPRSPQARRGRGGGRPQPQGDRGDSPEFLAFPALQGLLAGSPRGPAGAGAAAAMRAPGFTPGSARALASPPQQQAATGAHAASTRARASGGGGGGGGGAVGGAKSPAALVLGYSGPQMRRLEGVFVSLGMPDAQRSFIVTKYRTQPFCNVADAALKLWVQVRGCVGACVSASPIVG